MKAELMLNNYVKSKRHNGLITQIRSLNPDSVRLWANPFAVYKYDDIEPIPLTTEILEKCGFEKEYLSEFTIKFTHKNSVFGYDWHAMSGWKARYYDRYIECQSLHQLQNVFFGLVGTELEIRL